MATSGGSLSVRRVESRKRAEGGSAPLTNPQATSLPLNAVKKVSLTSSGSSQM